MKTAAAQLEAGRFPPHIWPWRSLQAIALAGAGEDDEARRLAHEELELARAFGAPHALGVSLRAWGWLARVTGLTLCASLSPCSRTRAPCSRTRGR